MAASYDVAELVAAVCEGAKYRHVDRGLVEAVATAEIVKGRTLKESVKAVRNKLHQVAGAYLPDRPEYSAWAKHITQAQTEEDRRSALRQVMSNHASTRERLPFLENFYATILGDLPPITSLVDLACGLNPLAAAWMPLAPGARYDAYDIYQDQIDFLNRIFAASEVQGEAHVANLLESCPRQAADVALLLKTIPCLEQLDKRIGPRLLAQINAPVLVVSFPARSLGGRAKGMVHNYAEHFSQMVDKQRWSIDRFDFSTEIVFRLTKE